MSEENDNQSDSQQEQPKQECQFSQEQYDLLKSCSEKKDMTEWNQWRKQHQDKEVLLQRVNLAEANLKGAWLREVNLQGAILWKADLQHTKLQQANLQGTDLREANLQGAKLQAANLQCARLWEANLQGARLQAANLQDADFSRAIVDGGTLIWKCEVDDKTKVEGVGLGNIRTYPETKQLLEYNIRRMNWQEWYKEGWLLTWITKRLFVQPFWWISNYGLSTWRIIATFLTLAIIFATGYFVWGAFDYYCLGIKDQPGIVNDLFIPITAENPILDVYYGAMIYFRSVYFSVVTMTTLGFGDMYANTARCGLRWWIGHLLLIVQVILGYVLLGALVTRFAVLFTAGGPAGRFSKSRLEKDSGTGEKKNAEEKS